MKISFFLLLGVIAFAVAQEIQLTKEQEDQIVSGFYQKFNIRVGRSMNGEVMRRNILDNYIKVEKHNSDENRTCDLELNEFSSMTTAEFAETRLGFNPPDYFEVDNSTIVPVVEKNIRQARNSIPTYWNWAEQGNVVQPVQNQGSCGS